MTTDPVFKKAVERRLELEKQFSEYQFKELAIVKKLDDV